ncbi:MAG: hypothetical protein KatS3mg015_1749 [Fimbriimonadales bacterium]|nr:MAG: hypothetical protein KatS3mg015_1749 [Fimbriimonadales bacterium]
MLRERLRVRTRAEGDILDLTPSARDIARRYGGDGVLYLFVTGSTAALTTIEYEDGLLRDFPEAMERLAPRDAHYDHEARWGDDNGHSHIRASVVGPSLTVPIEAGQLLLGTWQQIVLIEFDTRGRDREVIATILP